MAIRWDKFTIKSQEAIQRASDVAAQNGNPEILPVHLLAALVEDREGIVDPVLGKLGTNPATIAGETQDRINRLPKVSGGAQQPQLSAAMQKLLDQEFKEADKFKDEYVSTEHLLLATMQDKDRNNEARQILANAGVTYD